MPTQQETAHRPATTRDALRTALTTRGPRWSRITVNGSVIVLVPLLLWMAFESTGVPDWYTPVWYSAIALLFLSFMLSLAEESWTRKGATVTRVLGTALAVGACVAMIVVADLPLWALSTLYGGLAVIVIAAMAGKAVTYRDVREGDEETT